ncbi:hypothetical protein JI435_421310 [Parastagonospora nodorum SN15]|uniref:Uncharacterized protein n=1 Tax=Phaeosphaeria nodorum (strain SN15 / ATCC MYA-4574 / FGSC 10173) TaxID=321614 RepID=A0A7U2FFU6_PHANO|nr:hypothetical protein JI435_421310 [Parastagonospora nodorum SN15]
MCSVCHLCTCGQLNSSHASLATVERVPGAPPMEAIDSVLEFKLPLPGVAGTRHGRAR